MLKKSIHGFLNHDLAEVNSSKSYPAWAGLDFPSLAIWQSIHGLHNRVFFNTLLWGRLPAGLEKPEPPAL